MLLLLVCLLLASISSCSGSLESSVLCGLAEAVPALQQAPYYWRTCDFWSFIDELFPMHCLLYGVACSGLEVSEIVLDHANDYIGGSIPNSINKLSSLKTLKIKNMGLTGTIPDLSGLSKLAVLEMANMPLTGSIPKTGKALNTIMLRNLTLSGSVPAVFQDLSNLKDLELSQIGNITGYIPTKSKVLRSISYNGITITGTLPNMESLTSLKSLQLVNSKISGVIPDTFGSSLDIIDLHNNALSGTISSKLGTKHSSLKHFDISNNKISGVIPDTFASSVKHFSVAHNSLTGSIPATFNSFSSITFLDFSDNKLEGTLPSFKSVVISYYNMSKNQISGSLPSSISSLSLVNTVDVSSNLLSGTLPNFASLSRLFLMSLRDNNFIGSFPSTLGSTSLVSLKMDSNSFDGTIPTSLQKLTALTFLNISKNNFEGTIPDVWSKMTALTYLSIGNNRFEGNLPSSMKNLKSLKSLLMENSRFSGTFPLVVTALTQLQEFTIVNNSFTGTLPAEIQNLYSLNSIHFSHNGFEGGIPSSLFFLYKLKTIDLSWNNIGGVLAADFSHLGNLKSLILTGNKIEGTLPENMVSPYLHVLDLSFNKLSKSIPQDYFKNAVSLTHLKLNNNSFEGCPPNIGEKIVSCDIGGGFYSACTPKSYPCSLVIENDCAMGSGFYGSTCTPCTKKCELPERCYDGYDGTGECEVIDACLGHDCESECFAEEDSFSCRCPYLAVLSEDQKTCHCNPGFYKVKSPEMCELCTLVPGCIDKVSCTNATDSKCPKCVTGHYVDENGKCEPCKIVKGCERTVTCTNGNNSQCTQCPKGLFLNETGTSDLCTVCPSKGCEPPIECENKTGVIVVNCSCTAGYYKGTSGCEVCPSVPNCATLVTCTTANNSKCSSCSIGYKLKLGDPDTCEVETSCVFENWGGWSTCPLCSGALVSRARLLSSKNVAFPSVCKNDMVDIKECGFPCVDEDIVDPQVIPFYLYQSFVAYDWLEEQVNSTLDITYSDTGLFILHKPESAPTRLRALDCDRNLLELYEIVQNTTERIVPNVPAEEYNITISTEEGGCMVNVMIRSPETAGTKIGVSVGAGVGLFLLLVSIILLVLWYKYHKRNQELSYLPPDVSMVYRHYYGNTNSWKKMDTSVPFYYYELNPHSELWDNMMKLFKELFGQEGISLTEALAVYNPELVSAFINQMKIIHHRNISDPQLFLTKTYFGDEFRQWVVEKYTERTQVCLWNRNMDKAFPVILPALHFTSKEVAMEMCASGFLGLSALDEGKYGKGIYFTTHSQYLLPLITTSHNVFIVSYILPGNVYPVTEKSTDAKNLQGKPTKSGYNSHYVVTTAEQEPPSQPTEGIIFDEIVIPQDAQTTPVFVLTLEKPSLVGFEKEKRR
eukprot:TRINITY_DN9098_c0_g1_i1.p1 TRINITY_DN9098_c0_g1~~TRINITY_DN9098_c0_g1_i1.p1  ORF type:complete len:1383 (-),score=196.66 TRINITY_DN9098_c0_g1_i1:117-4265(-)